MAQHSLLKRALHPYITLGGLLLLFFLIITGTLYQTDHGLYEAQRLYFGYSIVWVGKFLPLPGASLVLWVLSLQVVLTMLFVMPLSWKKLGLWVSHIGLLILLIGGFITQKMAIESQLTLAEGEVGHFTTSYQDWELAIWESHGDTNTVLAYKDTDLRPGLTLALSPYPARITVNQYFGNADAFTEKATGGKTAFLNSSGITYLEARKPEKEAIQNAPGLMATLHENGMKDKDFLLFGLEPKPLPIKIGKQRVWMQLRRRHYPLTFSLKLTDFVRSLHPGTDMARSFESYADLQDGLSSRPVKIWMNNPLRYAGLTFFQASFSQEQGVEHSTFAVVTNPGRLLPYISSLTVFLGMLLHFMIRFIGYVKRTSIP